MKNQNSIAHRRFQYNYDRKKTTNVDFDIIEENGKRVAKNILLTSNFRIHYPKNPQISKNDQGDYSFFENGVWTTNGDIQQIILRIHLIVEKAID